MIDNDTLIVLLMTINVILACIILLVSMFWLPSTAFSSLARTRTRWMPLLARHRAVSALSAMPELPSDVVKYSQVPAPPKTFKAETIPSGLLKDHNTKAGTWGLIRVDRGKLGYQMNEPTQQYFELTAPATGVILPQMHHHVEALSDDVEFVVEFYRRPGTGPVDEKREGL